MSYTLTPEQQNRLLRLLKEIVKYTDLEALALVTRQGLNVAFFSEVDANKETFSALAAAIAHVGEMVSDKMQTGKLLEVIIRGEDGYTILSHAGEFILIGVSREVYSLGLATLVLRKHARLVPGIFKEERRGERIEDLIDELISQFSD